jgi:hypothetical protein
LASFNKHGGAAAAFALFAVVWTFPLITDLSGQVPGDGPGDNLQFLWNFWWMRHALAGGVDVFYTPFMFAPVGAPLILHTLTALPAYVAATVLAPLPLVAAMNVVILASLFLNGLCAYLLAWRVTGDRGAAMIGGLMFGGSSYLAGHLYGHFNLTSAWTLPLFAMTALEAVKGRKAWAFLAGLVLAVTAYVDYYYLILECALGAAIAATAVGDWSLTFQGRGSRTRTRLARAASVLAALAMLFVVTIQLTGGVAFDAGGRTISIRGLFNPLQIFWLLVALWLWLRLRPRITVARAAPREPLRPVFLIAIVTMLLGAAPVIGHAVALITSGDYVTQTYFWRTAPSGVDAATLAMGPPFHGLAGLSVRSVYDRLGITAIESSAWLGIVPIVLATFAIARHRDTRAVRQWSTIGLVFFVWALGPHLMVLGRNTGMILPGAFLRYIPIVNNARIPGRAMVVVSLAVALLGAVAAARWRPARGRRPLVLAALALCLVAESLPAPFPVTRLSAPALYQTLRDRPEAGAVCELPFAVRDGLGAGRGAMSELVFFYQTIHARPLVGGYLSRLPPSVVAAYARDPLLNGLLDLSEPGADLDQRTALVDARVAAERLRANGIAFVVLDRAAAPARLTEYVETVLPLDLVATEGERSLYVVRK